MTYEKYPKGISEFVRYADPASSDDVISVGQSNTGNEYLLPVELGAEGVVLRVSLNLCSLDAEIELDLRLST